jgi:hypothetical protein
MLEGAKAGAPGWNRTSDPQLRRLMLYPTELRAHAKFNHVAGEISSPDFASGPFINHLQ